MKQIDADVTRCSDCRLVDGDNLPSDQTYWTLENGMKLSIPGVGYIPLHSDYQPCTKHEAELIRQYPEA